MLTGIAAAMLAWSAWWTFATPAPPTQDLAAFAGAGGTIVLDGRSLSLPELLPEARTAAEQSAILRLHQATVAEAHRLLGPPNSVLFGDSQTPFLVWHSAARVDAALHGWPAAHVICITVRARAAIAPTDRIQRVLLLGSLGDTIAAEPPTLGTAAEP